MVRRSLVIALLFCGPVGTASVSVISGSSALSGASARAAEWSSCLETEAADERFWSVEFNAIEAQLVQLQAALNGTASAQAKEHHHEKSPLAGLKLNLEPKSPADLVPALAMLKGLYEDGKERIGQLNAREKDGKKKYEERLAKHNERLQIIETRFKNHTLSAEFRANETHDENRLWNYWEKVRERQHRQYHTSLKIQHGTLEKVKAMIDMYEKTIAGKTDKAEVSKELQKVGGGALPEVVFLQASEALSYFNEALFQIHHRGTESSTLSKSKSSRRGALRGLKKV